MRTLVFFLEEPSAREMLKGLLPRFLPPDVESRFVVFEGKQDLEKQLEKKLRGMDEVCVLKRRCSQWGWTAWPRK